VRIEHPSCTDRRLEFTNFSVVVDGLAIARLDSMQGAVRLMIAFGLVACAHPTTTPPIDGGNPGSDGGSGAGLTIPWTAAPGIPGPVANDVTITSMIFRVDSLRVVGDTGTSASLGNLQLQWNGEESPPAAMFSDAPSGLYSKVVFHADGQLIQYSWEIDGTAEVDGNTLPFAIHDMMALSADIDYSGATLEPGGNVVLGVTFEMTQPFNGLDMSKLNDVNGTLVLDTNDAEMPNFRTRLQQAIVPTHGGG
jgi:hypothetical protein